MSTKVVEIAKFKLRNGIADADFLVEDKKVHEMVIKQQPGYIKRTTVKSEDLEWVDLVWWNSLEEAQKAAKVIMADPQAKDWVDMMLTSAISLCHGAIISEFEQ
ncbi:hypothetical protein [Mastigocoleus testarum]|nr:hypothetical protein [Mastigocoleus testarum]